MTEGLFHYYIQSHNYRNLNKAFKELGYGFGENGRYNRKTRLTPPSFEDIVHDITKDGKLQQLYRLIQ